MRRRGGLGTTPTSTNRRFPHERKSDGLKQVSRRLPCLPVSGSRKKTLEITRFLLPRPPLARTPPDAGLSTPRRACCPQNVWLLAFLRLCLPWLHDHTRQICSCAHIYACAKLPPGEAVVLACFSSGKISKKSVEISPGFCYNISESLCSRAGTKNPRWQADT